MPHGKCHQTAKLCTGPTFVPVQSFSQIRSAISEIRPVHTQTQSILNILPLLFAGRNGLVAICLTTVREDIGSNHTVRFITTATAIYSLGHGLHTLTAVPRSTQPSTLRGMVKWVSAVSVDDGSLQAASHSKSVGLVWRSAAIWR